MMQLFKRYLPWLLALVFLRATSLYRPEAVRAQTEATATPTFRPLIFVRPNVTLVAPLLLVTPLQPTTVVSNVQL